MKLTDDISELLLADDAPLLSLLMPTHETGVEIRGDRIQFKNLLQEATEELKHCGMPEGNITRLLQPLHEKLEDETFWQHRQKGLAVYQSKRGVRIIDLPESVQPLTYVADHYFVKPLVLQQPTHQALWMLALTWDNAVLYRVSINGMTERNAGAFPVSREQLVGARVPEERLQQHAHHQQPVGQNRAGSQLIGGNRQGEVMFHGHGDEQGKIDADRLHYLAQVGKLLTEEERVDPSHLVLMATDEVAGHFTHATELDPALVVHASPATMAASEIFQRVQPTVQELVKSSSADWHERFETAKAREKASDDPEQVLQAAVEGRVGTLRVSPVQRLWGDWNAQSNRVTIRSKEAGGKVELTNLAVLKTVESGGDVIPSSGDEADNGPPLQGLYRY